jgi:hypothetical protein
MTARGQQLGAAALERSNVVDGILSLRAGSSQR